MKIRPFESDLRWKKEMLVELFFFLALLAVLAVYETSYDTNLKFNMGWIVIACTAGSIGSNMYEGIMLLVDQIKLKYIQLKKRFNAKKEKKRIEKNIIEKKVVIKPIKMTPELIKALKFSRSPIN
jgi:hypothetical protein